MVAGLAVLTLLSASCAGSAKGRVETSPPISPMPTTTRVAIVASTPTGVELCKIANTLSLRDLDPRKLVIEDASKVPTRLAPYLAIWEGNVRPRDRLAPSLPMVFVVHSLKGSKGLATLVLDGEVLSDDASWDYVSGTGLRWRTELMMGDGVAMRLEVTMGLTPDGRLRGEFMQTYNGLPAENFPAVALLDRCVVSSS